MLLGNCPERWSDQIPITVRPKMKTRFKARSSVVFSHHVKSFISGGWFGGVLFWFDLIDTSHNTVSLSEVYNVTCIYQQRYYNNCLLLCT